MVCQMMNSLPLVPVSTGLICFTPTHILRIYSQPLHLEKSFASAAVKEKMLRDWPYEVCVHVRWDLQKTKQALGIDWVANLGTCVNAKKEVMLFTMYKNVRDAVKQHLEGDDKQYMVHFASEVSPDGNLGLSNDKYAGIADMFSMGRNCVNLLASREASTYFTISANLMNSTRLFPGSSWIDGCLENTELTALKPSGDYWVDDDVCELRGYQCPVKNRFEDAIKPSNYQIQSPIHATTSPTKKFNDTIVTKVPQDFNLCYIIKLRTVCKSSICHKKDSHGVHYLQGQNGGLAEMIHWQGCMLAYLLIPKSGSTTARNTIKNNATKTEMICLTPKDNKYNPYTITFLRDPGERIASAYSTIVARFGGSFAHRAPNNNHFSPQSQAILQIYHLGLNISNNPYIC